MTTPIVDFVRRYAQSGTSRLHMPGHKGQSLLGFEPWDITEIKGADELYGADGIIAQSEANATRLFGTVHTYYSTEGSSQCIRAMLCLALQAAPAAGQRPVLLAARNAHKALLYAAALLDFDIQWLWPAPQDAGALCSCPVSAAKLTGALQGLAQQGRKPFGIYVTSPDYLGGVQDIAALAEVCKDFGVPLLVDNAHGAYLRFLPQGGQHPIA
ncbi:MAG: amino acid decarboxylase, partial [Faecalibacterium prausnitzii]|nr:amino acid decarboxylase [Faecalibacterium prausnitzii]